MTTTEARAREVVLDAICEWNGRDDDDAQIMSARREFTDAILTALAARGLEITDGWRPIESAPKDGTRIIGLINAGQYSWLGTVWWQPEFSAFIESCREMTMAKDYTFEDGTKRKLHSPEVRPVTHWIALPPPPAPEET